MDDDLSKEAPSGESAENIISRIHEVVQAIPNASDHELNSDGSPIDDDTGQVFNHYAIWETIVATFPKDSDRPTRPGVGNMTKRQMAKGGPPWPAEDGSLWYPSQTAIAAGADTFVNETHRRYREMLFQAEKITDEQLESAALIKPNRPKGRPSGSEQTKIDCEKLTSYLMANPNCTPTTAARKLFGSRSRADYVVKVLRSIERKKM